MLSVAGSCCLRWLRPSSVLVAVGCLLAAGGGAAAAEPVEELRQALKTPLHDPVERNRELHQVVGAVQGLPALRKAVVLQEWRDADVDDRIATVDRAHRAALMARFEQAVREALHNGDDDSRLAVVHLLAEQGGTARGLGTRHGLLRGFTPDLVQLMKQGRPAVREAAARALGRIDPEPATAAAAFGELLGPGPADAALRQAAAEGLANWMHVFRQQLNRRGSDKGPDASAADVIAVGMYIVPVAARGLADGQAAVRRPCAEAIGQAAGALGKLAADRRAAAALASDQTQAEQQAKEWAEMEPLFDILNTYGAAVARAVEDPDAEVQTHARQTLEDLAKVTPPAAATAQGARLTPTGFGPAAASDPAMSGLREKLPALLAALSSRDVRSRREAIDVLETLGPAAAPAAFALVQALEDPDRFVRWAAARTLGRIGPAAAPASVARLAQLLADPDLDVRLAAAAALDRYGLAARDAAPALVGALSTSAAEMRVAALRALGSIGADAPTTVTALVAALADADARVRRTAARELCRLGPAARDAAEPLRKALADADADVRTAAGDALLAIQGKGLNN